MAAQAKWHGNIETSTDTLVPELLDDRLCNERSTSALSNSKWSATSENGTEMSAENNRSPFMIDFKSKTLPNGNLISTMDESIVIQPEQPRMEISNGNRHDTNQLLSTVSVPNGNANGNVSLQRCHRNSFNSKQSSYIADITSSSTYIRPDCISPNTNKLIQPNTNRVLASTQSTLLRTNNTTSQTPTTNISAISCPDGLAHALSEQNLRLQQIVHEHKVSECFCY